MDPLPPSSDPGLPPTPAPVVPTAPTAAPIPPAAPLEQALRSQQFLLRVVMLVLLVILGTTTMALFHQIRWLAGQAIQLNGTVQELGRSVGDYETNTAPHVVRLITDLRRFAEGNPDFAKTFSKYRIAGEAPAGGAPGTSNAAPASPGTPPPAR
jgi:hypothetical protein